MSSSIGGIRSVSLRVSKHSRSIARAARIIASKITSTSEECASCVPNYALLFRRYQFFYPPIPTRPVEFILRTAGPMLNRWRATSIAAIVVLAWDVLNFSEGLMTDTLETLEEPEQKGARKVWTAPKLEMVEISEATMQFNGGAGDSDTGS